MFIKVRNVEKYIVRLSGLRKWLNKFNGDLLDFGLIEINLRLLGVNGQEVRCMLDTTEYKSQITILSSKTMYEEPKDEH